jgi:NAD(P)H-hydrate epimerase
MGAAVLSAMGCLRAGAGLLTCHIPSAGMPILQTSVPEAMLMTDFNSSYVTKLETETDRFNAIGIGPGIGTAQETRQLLRELLNSWRGPLVIDADALNNISMQPAFLTMLPSGTLLTPHPKEFERLFGADADDFARVEKALAKAKELGIVIILKGHHTLIASPDGRGYFNSSGNPGMATAGTGDLLTGILTGLLAQGYLPLQAALLGVYLHGLAGDLAAEKQSEEALLASDMAKELGNAFKMLKTT